MERRISDSKLDLIINDIKNNSLICYNSDIFWSLKELQEYREKETRRNDMINKVNSDKIEEMIFNFCEVIQQAGGDIEILSKNIKETSMYDFMIQVMATNNIRFYYKNYEEVRINCCWSTLASEKTHSQDTSKTDNNGL